ncbi:hypothetical protein, partial [Bathymodiolus heckerae thiotrophic gill symbiont]|uniref:hypothetical protein n=1 Tax=Bathymodiolus heckerae thiotrophic gill symbiont TaxID=1052212 RepID=UPI0014851622
STYGALELNQDSSIEAVLGLVKGKHEVSSSTHVANNQDSNGYFASVAYRGDLQKNKLNLSPFIRYDISRIKMKANNILTSSETTTDKALAIGLDLSNSIDYRDGKLNRTLGVEYKANLSNDNTDYLSKNAEKELTINMGVDYQKDNSTVSVSYERVQSTNNKAHSDGIEGTIRWKF